MKQQLSQVLGDAQVQSMVKQHLLHYVLYCLLMLLQKEMDSLLGTQEKLRQRNADLSGMLSQIQEKKVVIFAHSKYTQI